MVNPTRYLECIIMNKEMLDKLMESIVTGRPTLPIQLGPPIETESNSDSPPPFSFEPWCDSNGSIIAFNLVKNPILDPTT